MEVNGESIDLRNLGGFSSLTCVSCGNKIRTANVNSRKCAKCRAVRAETARKNTRELKRFLDE